MLSKKLHITLLLSMIWSFFYAQQYTNYSTKEGLPSNHVYRITQDAKGFLWFITDKGMVKYNGTDFKTFTTREGLPTNDIWKIIPTPDGKIWHFSKSPKLGYIKNDSVYSFSSTVKNEILNPVQHHIIGNEIRIINTTQTHRLKNGKWNALTPFYTSGVYTQFIKHSKIAQIVFAENSKEVRLLDKDKKILHKYDSIINTATSHSHGQINDSTFCWNNDEHLVFLNLNNFKIKTISIEKDMGIKNTKYVRCHLVNNHLQFTGEGFVAVLDKNYDVKKTITIPKALKSHFSFIDKNENLWIATFSNGIYKLPKSKQHTTYFLKGDKIGALKKINAKIIATVYKKGFYYLDSIHSKFIPLFKETDFCYGAYRFDELNTNYYITEKKIIQIENNKKIIKTFSKSNLYSNETARQLVYYKNYMYGNSSSSFNKLKSPNLDIIKRYPQNGIRTFVPYNGAIIIATSNGLKTFKNDSIKYVNFNSREDNIVQKKPILSLVKNKNHLLVGTDGFGLFTTNLKTTSQIKNTENLSVSKIQIEGGTMWLSTNDGVYSFLNTQDDDYKFLDHYNENDGLLSKNVTSVFPTKTHLLISSNLGIVRIPKKKFKSNHLLNLYVDKVSYNNQNLKLEGQKYSKNNTVNFSIATIDFRETKKTDYKYKLSPIHRNWTQTNSNNFSFNDLPPNNYTLSVKKNNIEKSYTFKIIPLWYQTLWAKIAFVLSVLFCLTAFGLFIRKKELKKQAVKLNTAKKLADFELHALRSQMNPHFVFNSLNAIQYYITNNQSDLSEKYLVKFSRLIRMFFDFSHAKEISLFDELKLLKSYLEIEKMRFGNDFNFNFNIDPNLDLHKNTIPTMLLQPIVENAVNHGIFHNKGKGLIEVFFTYVNDSTYEVNIIDDGVGVKKSKEIQAQSLKKQIKGGIKSSKVLNERIALLNQAQFWQVKYKLIDNSKEKKGTIVQLIFKKNDYDKNNINRR